MQTTTSSNSTHIVLCFISLFVSRLSNYSQSHLITHRQPQQHPHLRRVHVDIMRPTGSPDASARLCHSPVKLLLL